MSTFSQSSFGSDKYLALRPVYPPSLYSALQKYAGGQIKLAVDVGTGPGEAARQIGEFSEHVVGLDPSETMVRAGNSANPPANVRLEVGGDASLVDKFEAGSVDLVTAAEAAHWFAYPEFWHQAATVLKPGGTLAFWGYCDWSIVGKPASALDVVLKYTYGDEYLGPYGESKGRTILRNNYVDLLPLPSDLFTDVVHHTASATGTPAHDEILDIQRTATLSDIGEYVRTYSAYHNWRAAHPDTPISEDPVSQMINELQTTYSIGPNEKVTVRWNTVYVFARRTG